jgi:hypothetical protein
LPLSAPVPATLGSMDSDELQFLEEQLAARACYALAAVLSIVEERPRHKEARYGPFAASQDLRYGVEATSAIEKTAATRCKVHNTL